LNGRSSIGVESEYAVATPGKAFSAPGPYCIQDRLPRAALVLELQHDRDFDEGILGHPYRMLPERTSVNHGPCMVRRVIRFPLLTTVPDHVPAFARLFVPAFDRLERATNVPSSLIWRTTSPSSVYSPAPTWVKEPRQVPVRSLAGEWAAAIGSDVSEARGDDTEVRRRHGAFGKNPQGVPGGTRAGRQPSKGGK
jgi:hypothetical protein